jgi:hypothetical protein
LIGAPFYSAVAPVAGAADLDISGYVDQPLTAVFQYPATGHLVEYATSLYQIKVQIGERYIDEDGDLNENWGATSSAFYVLKGGVSNRQFSIWAIAGTNFSEVYLDGKKWLTQRPWGDYVAANQPVKLWFISPNGVSSDFTVKAYYSDGTNATGDTLVTLAAAKLYEFNAHPTAVGLAMTLQNGAKCNYYDVYLDGVSDSRRFQVDYSYCERPMWLMFANSLGGVDDVFVRGYATEGFKTEGTEAYRPYLPTDTVFNRTVIVPEKQGQNVWKLNTGHKTVTQMLHLRDLLVSRQVWLLYPNLSLSAYMVIPVNISTGQVELIDRAQDLYSLEIEASEAHVSQFNFDNRLI